MRGCQPTQCTAVNHRLLLQPLLLPTYDVAVLCCHQGGSDMSATSTPHHTMLYHRAHLLGKHHTISYHTMPYHTISHHRAHLLCVPTKFLTQGEGRGVHAVGAPNLDDGSKLSRLGGQCSLCNSRHTRSTVMGCMCRKGKGCPVQWVFCCCRSLPLTDQLAHSCSGCSATAPPLPRLLAHTQLLYAPCTPSGSSHAASCSSPPPLLPLPPSVWLTLTRRQPS